MTLWEALKLFNEEGGYIACDNGDGRVDWFNPKNTGLSIRFDYLDCNWKHRPEIEEREILVPIDDQDIGKYTCILVNEQWCKFVRQTRRLDEGWEDDV